MMARFKTLDRSGATAMEFALIVPLWITMIFAFINISLYFYAAAGLKHAIDEAARYATIWPTPTDAQIAARIDATRFGYDPTRLGTPTIQRGSSQGSNYVEITLNYPTSLNLVVARVPATTITESRRAYLSWSAS
jgi:Flp pilus assembly protein TadG